MRTSRCLYLPVVAMLALVLAACSRPGPEFTIVSGSENDVLEPIVMEFCRSRNAQCTMRYSGSLDIALSLKPGSQIDADAVWPASSIWIDVFDEARRIKGAKSIAQMPVILGIRRSKAEALGWVGRPVRMADILSAVDGKQLSFLMSSATQSNSGAAAYLSMLGAALGKTDLIEAGDLDGNQVQDIVRRMLSGVARSAGSSGWLADLLVESETRGTRYDGMWNYEAVIKGTNERLRASGQEPLYAVYPVDGVAMADSPLGFVDRGRGPEVEEFFRDLQAHLLSNATQEKIAATGRRSEGARPMQSRDDIADNLDPGRSLAIIRPPDAAVIRKALNIYQEVLRRPSLSALCLDVSGSMEGKGEEQLLEAMRFLLSPERTRDVLVQWTRADIILALPFNSRVFWAERISGDPAAQSRLLQRTLTLRAGGGTDFYTCAERALAELLPLLQENLHLPAIVIMTDGKSEGSIARFQRAHEAAGGKVPVFGITFGDGVDRRQLDALAKLTGGRVFDGTKSLSDAFRAVRGYN